ncbi:hypothetical protein T4E_10337 [Trichinella pseudospiralis]|uniref:Uncharacterized protein n=1 Tax=Trichinella pseudospiralis TaxID=6337 RepID=A0A0V0XEL7_TRIPS|nr:hypothetical protein T4E_10337 [Trichinella pseudospiralis]
MTGLQAFIADTLFPQQAGSGLVVSVQESLAASRIVVAFTERANALYERASNRSGLLRCSSLGRTLPSLGRRSGTASLPAVGRTPGNSAGCHQTQVQFRPSGPRPPCNARGNFSFSPGSLRASLIGSSPTWGSFPIAVRHLKCLVNSSTKDWMHCRTISRHAGAFHNAKKCARATIFS